MMKNVRSIALLTLLLTSSALAAPEPPKFIAPAPTNESVVVRLPDDELRLFYIHRPEGTELRSISSRDNGLTWSEPRTEFALPGVAYYAVQAVVDRRGEVQVAFHVAGKSDRGYRGRLYNVWTARTTGGRAKWEPPKLLLTGYSGSLRGYSLLKSGRLLLPLNDIEFERMEPPTDGSPDLGWIDALVATSDDDGATWTLGKDRLSIVQDPARGRTRYGAPEPHTVQLKDGRVWMLIRTKNGQFWESISTDDGATWPQPTPARRLVSSDSPACTLRLKDGRLVLFFNQCQRWDDPRSYAIGGRETLHAAISGDDGKTWRGVREVLRDPYPPERGDRGTAYASAEETADGKILLVSGQGEKRRSILRIDPAWIEETSARDDFASDLANWTAYEAAGVSVEADATAPGRKAMVLRRSDAKLPAAAVWNFPAARSGEVKIRLRLDEGSSGAAIALTDHYSVSGDAQADANAVATLAIAADGKVLDGTLKMGQWAEVALSWREGGDAARVTLDGKSIGTVPMARPPALGMNYLRVRDAAAAPGGGGVRVASVASSSSDANVVSKSVGTIRFPADRPLRVAFLGDSITKGARPARGAAPAVAEADTFAARVPALLASRGLKVAATNAGKSSDRTDGALARFDADVLPAAPDVVVLMFGTNDSCVDLDKAGPRLSAATFAANLRTLIARTRDAGAVPVLMTEPALGPTWSNGRHASYVDRGDNYSLAAFMDVARTVASESGVPVIDHFAAWTRESPETIAARLTDGCHPNAEGHRELADRIAAFFAAAAVDRG